MIERSPVGVRKMASVSIPKRVWPVLATRRIVAGDALQVLAAWLRGGRRQLRYQCNHGARQPRGQVRYRLYFEIGHLVVPFQQSWRSWRYQLLHDSWRLLHHSAMMKQAIATMAVTVRQ